MYCLHFDTIYNCFTLILTCLGTRDCIHTYTHICIHVYAFPYILPFLPPPLSWRLNFHFLFAGMRQVLHKVQLTFCVTHCCWTAPPNALSNAARRRESLAQRQKNWRWHNHVVATEKEAKQKEARAARRAEFGDDAGAIFFDTDPERFISEHQRRCDDLPASGICWNLFAYRVT